MSEESVVALVEAFNRFEAREIQSKQILCLLDELSGQLAKNQDFRYSV